MASSREYLDFVLEQLSELEEITYRAMMGEYIIYYRGKIIGGIYDDRLLVKPVKAAISLIPDKIYELPYEGAKEMLLVNDIDSKDFLARLFIAMHDELPTPKKEIKKFSLKERKIMKKEKSEKMCFICFLVASICFYIVAIMNFIDKDISTAVIFLCLGSSFLCLSTTHLNKNDTNKKDE